VTADPHRFRAGDVVRHRPSGEEWTLAYGHGDFVSACGWPEGEAYARDCDLVKAASDEEHEAMLRVWADAPQRRDDGSLDRRSRVCLRQLAELDLRDLPAIAAWSRYRKRPVVIQAIPSDRVRQIATLEGVMRAEIGDWIIRGVAGELYPCKPDIFEKTYEAAGPGDIDRLDELRATARRWRETAASLRREVENGIAIRQSPESKLARAEVLESNADAVERICGGRSDG
jgi:hypothetical protein